MFDNTSTSDEGGFREQDRLLPIANVSRIMKQILPSNAKISKEAKETMQDCVSEFIGFVTSEASERCRKERRKTINGDDICIAMAALGLDDMAGPLRRYLHRYREIEGEKERANQGRNNYGDNNEVVRDRNNDEQSPHSGVINILSHRHRNHDNQGEASTSVSEFDLEERRNRYNNTTRPF